MYLRSQKDTRMASSGDKITVILQVQLKKLKLFAQGNGKPLTDH